MRFGVWIGGFQPSLRKESCIATRRRESFAAAAILLMILTVLAASAPAYSAGRQFRMALPGYAYRFPHDHYSHNDFKTEWWYYTGHLLADDGNKYGYELTFFRSAMNVPNGVPATSPWNVENVYLAHFAVSDLSRNTFFHTQRLNRPGIGLAGAKTDSYDVWNGDWSVKLEGNKQVLKAHSRDYDIALDLTPEKAPAINGENGVSQKASCYGCASHYYSFTRLETQGTLQAHGKQLKVKGLSWMDHEFGSNQLTADQVGWDWFSIQLDNKTELMLYQMRQSNHKIDPNSSGTFIATDGKTQHLRLDDYSIRALGTWHSKDTGATYPMGWHVEVPKQHLAIDIKPDMTNQELVKQQSADVSYWEGSSSVSGTVDGRTVRGEAYVEMTGYAENFKAHI